MDQPSAVYWQQIGAGICMCTLVNSCSWAVAILLYVYMSKDHLLCGLVNLFPEQRNIQMFQIVPKTDTISHHSKCFCAFGSVFVVEKCFQCFSSRKMFFTLYNPGKSQVLLFCITISGIFMIFGLVS